jgi:outer membrane protein OmpA-like peptidoglycan-associated protein
MVLRGAADLQPGARGKNTSVNARTLAAAALSCALLLPAVAGAQSNVETRWSSYRDFWFDYGSAVLDPSYREGIRDAADYLRAHPAYRLAIDAQASEGDGLRQRRVAAIRDALLAAGVPKYKIQEGGFGDEQLRRERRVEILIDTSRD